MPQFLVTARDGTDAEAPARRAAARPAHLAGLAKLAEFGGTMIVGGATLDDAGTPTGSTMIVEFPDRAAVDAWIAADPYTAGGVWRDVSVVAYRIAVERGAKS